MATNRPTGRKKHYGTSSTGVQRKDARYIPSHLAQNVMPGASVGNTSVSPHVNEKKYGQIAQQWQEVPKDKQKLVAIKRARPRSRDLDKKVVEAKALYDAKKTVKNWSKSKRKKKSTEITRK